MESLLIINSTLVAVCLYFVRDYHKDFKEVCKKVDKLETDIKIMSMKMDGTIKEEPQHKEA